MYLYRLIRISVLERQGIVQCHFCQFRKVVTFVLHGALIVEICELSIPVMQCFSSLMVLSTFLDLSNL